ncbi:vitamin K-dependent protein S-like isoform X2 [Cyprinus carpio]|uniref:Vitamin K-dependent protein S-like isoform X2 n=1 Tax=Cyprinus carpio TaxID=7962 RepID=A0A9Q9XTK7_CYPCA|nr:vitamin K-dependent protein S-like isoform X2 [Cyprinus carpio]
MLGVWDLTAPGSIIQTLSLESLRTSVPVFKRSVTSVCRCRAIRTVMSAVWTVRAPSRVSVKPDGGVSAVSRILMSVKTQNSLRDAAKNVTTSPAASCAAVRRASTPKTTSTASVRVTAQVRDINECILYRSVCVEPSQCINAPGTFECRCPLGYQYNMSSHECVDLDECEQDVCDGECVNTIGSFSCHCDGRKGVKLAEDSRQCEKIPKCLDLYDHKHEQILHLGEQFYMHFRLQADTKFAAEFDFRTFDPEGVILYAESLQDSWFMLGLRSGHIEVQYKNEHSIQMTSAGKAINDGQWHVISVEELMGSITVKISKEAIMSINSPKRLFNDKLKTKVYIAGLPDRNESLIKPINPRLDGCIRGWNLMNQDASEGVKEVFRQKESKHCYVHVEKGSFFSGEGLALFNIDYGSTNLWKLDVVMSIRPSSSTGVLFALVSNHSVPLSVAVVTQGPDDANLQFFMDGICVATLQSLMLCYPDRLVVEMKASADGLHITANSSSVSYSDSETLSMALSKLNSTMQSHVHTYIGGLPDLPLSVTPISAFYHGCLEINVNGQQLDFDEAASKDNSIKSHSCPPVSAPDPPSADTQLH